MKLLKVLLKFLRLKDSDFTNYCQAVVNSLTGNTNYTTPVPTLIKLQAAIDDFQTAKADQLAGGKTATATKNESRDFLELLMRQEATYVQCNCNNDLAILLSSGFSQVQHGGKRPIPGVPQNVSLNGSLKAALKLKADRISDASGYLYRYTTDATLQAGWVLSSPMTKPSALITGLTKGTEVYSQMRSFNSKGESYWSETASRVVL